MKQSSSLAGNTGLYICPDLCPPNSPVDCRICGLMQECVHTVQTPVCDQRLQAAPQWHIGKHVTKRHWQSSWSMEKSVACKHEGKM